MSDPSAVAFLHCHACGKQVSTAFVPSPTDTPDKGLVVRAWIECPECIEQTVVSVADETRALRARVQELEQERDDLRRDRALDGETVKGLLAKVAELEAEVANTDHGYIDQIRLYYEMRADRDRLEREVARLKGYVKHKADCEIIVHEAAARSGQSTVASWPSCTCGLEVPLTCPRYQR